MNQQMNFQLPTRVLFGRGRIRELAAAVPSSLVRAGFVAQAMWGVIWQFFAVVRG